VRNQRAEFNTTTEPGPSRGRQAGSAVERPKDLCKGTVCAMKKYSERCIFLLHAGVKLVFFECELTLPSARVRIAKEDESKN
jgi:hypothetical protein